MLGVVLTSLIPPQILKIIIDRNLVPKSSEGLLHLAALYLVTLLFIGVFDFLKEAILTILGQKITTRIRLEMMYKLGKIKIRYFSAHESGTVVSRFTNDVEAINTLFTSGVVGMIISSFKIIALSCPSGCSVINWTGHLAIPADHFMNHQTFSDPHAQGADYKPHPGRQSQQPHSGKPQKCTYD